MNAKDIATIVAAIAAVIGGGTYAIDPISQLDSRYAQVKETDFISIELRIGQLENQQLMLRWRIEDGHATAADIEEKRKVDNQLELARERRTAVIGI